MKVSHIVDLDHCRHCGRKTRSALVCGPCGEKAYARGLKNPTVHATDASDARIIEELVRDLRFTAGNNQVWGEGNWTKCPCTLDSFRRPCFHHKDAHQ